MRTTNCITSVKGRKKPKNKPITIGILASQPGYRMKSYGSPSLLKLGCYTLLDIQIKAIKTKFRAPEIVLCTGYESNKVVKYIKSKYPSENIRVVENQMFEHSNCCESLRLCVNNINTDSLLIFNGELVLYPELVNLDYESSFVLCHQPKTKKTNMEIGAVCDDKGYLTNMDFGLPHAWNEIFYLDTKKEIDFLRKILWSDTFKNKLVFEAINEVKDRYKIRQVNSNLLVHKIDNVKSYHKIRDKYESNGSQLYLRNFN